MFHLETIFSKFTNAFRNNRKNFCCSSIPIKKKVCSSQLVIISYLPLNGCCHPLTNNRSNWLNKNNPLSIPPKKESTEETPDSLSIRWHKIQRQRLSHPISRPQTSFLRASYLFLLRIWMPAHFLDWLCVAYYMSVRMTYCLGPVLDSKIAVAPSVNETRYFFLFFWNLTGLSTWSCFYRSFEYWRVPTESDWIVGILLFRRVYYVELLQISSHIFGNFFCPFLLSNTPYLTEKYYCTLIRKKFF